MPEFDWIADGIFTITDFCSADECAGYIQRAESLGFGDAPITTAAGPVMATDVRNNARVMIDDLELGRTIWERARLYVPARLGAHVACGVNERFRFYRYDPGQVFRWHRDGYYERPDGARSQFTFMIYLNDDFEGDETRFHDATIRPVTGMALVFVHHLPHEGSAVIRGRKYVMRTDVMHSA